MLSHSLANHVSHRNTFDFRSFSLFLVRSTNGTQVNGEDLEPQTPFKLNEGDVICMGSTEVKVNISDFDDLENVEEVSV